jgi:5-methyltetrahydropteroyltriglutamate--homocysteine methyltransferase
MNPPFRAEHIGSLLRPASLLALRRNGASPHELAAAEDRAIAEAVALQDRIGLRLATDGEFRRRSYHSYFYAELGDIAPDAVGGEAGGQLTARSAQPAAVIRSKVRWSHPIHVADFELLRGLTARVPRMTPKITIPGPCVLHFRGGDAAVLAHAYNDVDEFWEDIVAAFRAELQALAVAGCTYVQIDETAFAKFGDPDVQAALAARGDDWRELIDRYIAVTNRVIDGLPETLHVGMHLCRGNRAGRWHAEGSYDAVADKLFNALHIPFYFLEYDTPRAGTFTPLRLVPREKAIVLGLVSTKTATLEAKDVLKVRVDEASRYVDIDRLGLSPQCGFASVDDGNPVTPDVQEAKLRLVAALAEDIWGTP